jgi:hypothetical protein
VWFAFVSQSRQQYNLILHDVLTELSRTAVIDIIDGLVKEYITSSTTTAEEQGPGRVAEIVPLPPFLDIVDGLVSEIVDEFAMKVVTDTIHELVEDILQAEVVLGEQTAMREAESRLSPPKGTRSPVKQPQPPDVEIRSGSLPLAVTEGWKDRLFRRVMTRLILLRLRKEYVPVPVHVPAPKPAVIPREALLVAGESPSVTASPFPENKNVIVSAHVSLRACLVVLSRYPGFSCRWINCPHLFFLELLRGLC